MNNILRVIDANLNRSREGLRVCEDVARFILNSPELTASLKKVRHGISDVAKLYYSKDIGIISCSRDSKSDVGRISRIQSELERLDVFDIFAANIERVKEALRVLEEFSKLSDKKAAHKFASLRFDVYEIEKKAAGRIARGMVSK